jgi:molybdate transport system ATP-binding protein
MLQVTIKKKLGNFLLNVDFQMEGGVFAILGASGCGKSMTLKCIAGIERPDEGRIILNDSVLFDSQKRINLPPQKRKVGYMFQDYALFPNMNVVQNIQAGMGRKPDPKKVAEYINGFQLQGLENHMPDQLSGGQKQRVAMARMLAAEPEVILLDEPFAALDSYLKWQMEQQMLELLQKIQKPVLFVSHSRDEVYRLCDTVSCINQGKMEVIEPVKEFFKNPKTKTAALLSGCKNICSVEQSSGKLWAAGWGTALSVSKEALQAHTIGIRAHDLTIEKPQQEHVSEFLVGDYRIMEDPFEWNLSFRKDDTCEWMQWKISKREWNPSMGVPKRLYVKEEDLLLLDKQ